MVIWETIGSFGGIPHSPRCCWFVKSLSFFILCLYDQGDNTLTEISPFEVKCDEQKLLWTIQSAWRDKNYTDAYVPIYINQELNLLLSRGFEHVSSMARWNRLHEHKNILSHLPSQTAYWDILFHINTQLESNTSP